MFTKIKIDTPPDKVRFTSDLHIGHARSFIIEPRGYTNVTDHDNGLVHNWNAVCDDQTVVFNLGDVTFNDPTGERFLNLHRRLRFRRVYLLIGNHVSGMRQVYLKELDRQHEEAVDRATGVPWYEVYPLTLDLDGNHDKQITFLPEYVEVSPPKPYPPLVLCHYPILSFNGQGQGAMGLFGHSHNGCEWTHKDRGRGRRLDVGVDAFP